MTIALISKVMKFLRKKAGQVQHSGNDSVDTNMAQSGGNMPGKILT